MNKYIFLGIVYFYTTCLTLLLPSSEGYENLVWKLSVGQLYSIPVTIVIFLLFLYIQKKKAVVKQNG